MIAARLQSGRIHKLQVVREPVHYKVCDSWTYTRSFFLGILQVSNHGDRLLYSPPRSRTRTVINLWAWRGRCIDYAITPTSRALTVNEFDYSYKPKTSAYVHETGLFSS